MWRGEIEPGRLAAEIIDNAGEGRSWVSLNGNL